MVWFSVTIAVVALLLVATILVTGPFRSIIGTVLGGPGPIMREGVEQIYTSDYNSKQESKEAGDALNVQIASEGFVLLMNDGNGLPIRTPESETDAAAERPKISVFGKNSVNLVYGGSGSGGGSGETATTLYEALADGGYDVNPTLQEFYEGSASGSGRGDNPTLSTGADTAPTLPIGETPITSYTNDVISSFREYNDARSWSSPVSAAKVSTSPARRICLTAASRAGITCSSTRTRKTCSRWSPTASTTSSSSSTR